MNKFNKLWAAIGGVGGLIALRYFEIEFFGFDAVALDLVVGSLTAFGVYQVRNAP